MKTDADIRSDVVTELHWDPSIAAATVEVDVTDGVVVFNGTLQSHAQQHAIEKAAGRIAGVKALVFETRVVLPEDHRREDVEIAKAAGHAFEWSAVVPNGCVRVTVEQGWVTLHGNAAWEFERLAAERAVRDVTGVTGITNLIEITPQVMATEVERQIFDALARQAHREGRRIEIVVDGATVTLRGRVHSLADRAAAQAAAWSSPGVKAVVNALTVQPAFVPMG